MDAADLQHYKRLLLAKLDELSATRTDAAAPVIGAGVSGGDLIDQAAARTEAELQVCVHQSDARLMRAIEEALSRIRQGIFGVCESCQQPISHARLEAVPWARHCRDCKEQEHADSASPTSGAIGSEPRAPEPARQEGEQPKGKR